MGFIRIMTSRRILGNPYRPNEILDIVGESMELPHCDLAHPGRAHFTHLEGSLRKAGTVGDHADRTTRGFTSPARDSLPSKGRSGRKRKDD